jgi:ribosome-associated protein
MDIRKLQRVVIDALEDVKAQDIKVFNTIGLSDMFDRVVLASGTSNRQTRALAYRVAQQIKEAGGHVVSVEGADAGEWVLVDLGDLVVHVMQPAIREYYALEEIWGGKPVKMKLAETGARRIVAQASDDDAPAPQPVEPVGTRKAPRKTPVARKATPAKKATRTTARKPAKAVKAASKAASPGKKTAAKKKSAPRRPAKTARKKARA